MTELKARFVDIPDYPGPPYDEDGEWEFDGSITLEDINEAIFQRYDKNTFRKGDCVRLGGDDYRNSGVYIFDGEKFIELASKIDDYGYVPKCITFTELGVPCNYWNEAIDHNSIIWPENKYVKEIIKNGKNREFIYTVYDPDGEKEMRANFFYSEINVPVENNIIKYHFIYAKNYEWDSDDENVDDEGRIYTTKEQFKDNLKEKNVYYQYYGNLEIAFIFEDDIDPNYTFVGFDLH